MAPITIIPKACSCCKGERSSRDKSSNLPLPNILYEGSEGGGGGFAADYNSPQIIKRGRGWHRRLCRRVVSPQGKRLTMICTSLALLHPLLSLTHWIFRSLMLPYKSSSHSANHVCCASLRSGSKETRKLAAFPMDMQGFETSTHRKLSL